jgi:hypothetical protein
VVVVVVVARAGLVEVVAVVEAGSWLWGPPVVVVMAGLRARLGVAEGVVEAEALGQEVGKVGASLPASGAQACHWCWHWGAQGEAAAQGLQL